MRGFNGCRGCLMSFVVLIPMIKGAVLPETSRSVVSNGSRRGKSGRDAAGKWSKTGPRRDTKLMGARIQSLVSYYCR